MVDVVQLVEHRIVVPSVVGSSPIIHPLIAEPFRPGDFFLRVDDGTGRLQRPFRISAEIGWAMKAKMVVQVDGIQKAF